jgi:NACalpha-BTF3-like transcription factor
MYYSPSEQDIQRVMQQTGMERVQAINHLHARHLAQQRVAEEAQRYPLGKSNHYN